MWNIQRLVSKLAIWSHVHQRLRNSVFILLGNYLIYLGKIQMSHQGEIATCALGTGKRLNLGRSWYSSCSLTLWLLERGRGKSTSPWGKSLEQVPLVDLPTWAWLYCPRPCLLVCQLWIHQKLVFCLWQVISSPHWQPLRVRAKLTQTAKPEVGTQ